MTRAMLHSTTLRRRGFGTPVTIVLGRRRSKSLYGKCSRARGCRGSRIRVVELFCCTSLTHASHKWSTTRCGWQTMGLRS